MNKTRKEWTFTPSVNINDSKEFIAGDTLSATDLNVICNNSLYAADTASELNKKVDEVEKNIITAQGTVIRDVSGKVETSLTLHNDLNADERGILSAKVSSEQIAALNAGVNSILDAIYPVGSIYMSVNNVSPATFFGGTWDSFGEGRTLVGYSAGDSDFNAPNKTGGSKQGVGSHSHTPMVDSSLGHFTIQHAGTTSNNGISDYWGIVSRDAGSGLEGYHGFYGTGGRVYNSGVSFKVDFPSTNFAGSANGNLPPYIVCYMWKRSE